MKKRFVVCRLAMATAVLTATQIANAAVFNYTVNLTGPSENPANVSPATASGTVAYDNVAHTLALNLAYSGLTGTVTQTHFHATTATSGVTNPPSSVANVSVAIGNSSLPGFTTGATSGVYANVLNLTDSSIYTSSFVTGNGGNAAGAEAAFAAALAAGKTYWNIHTTTFGGGEIRGFPTPVPEPTTIALASLGLLALRRRRK